MQHSSYRYSRAGSRFSSITCLLGGQVVGIILNQRDGEEAHEIGEERVRFVAAQCVAVEEVEAILHDYSVYLSLVQVLLQVSPVSAAPSGHGRGWLRIFPCPLRSLWWECQSLRKQTALEGSIKEEHPSNLGTCPYTLPAVAFVHGSECSVGTAG